MSSKTVSSTDVNYVFALFQITFNVQGEELIIPLSKEDNEDEEPESTSDGAIQQVLVAKDAGLISDESYHELRMSLPEDQRVALPPVNAVKTERKRQNEIISIHLIPEVGLPYYFYTPSLPL